MAGKTKRNELTELHKRIAKMELPKTPRKRAKGAFQSSEEHYRLLAENVTDVIWTMDMDLRFTYVSPSVAHMLGYTAEETMSLTLADIFTHSSLQIFTKALTEEFAIENTVKNDHLRSRTLELEQLRREGSVLPVEIKVTFLQDPDGNAIGILGVTRDVTERKKMEEQLRQSQLLASLGKMTAGIAHEVNNPLGSILLYSELLMKSNLPHQTKKDLRVIHDEAKRAAKVMTDLLTYSLGVSNKTERSELHRIINKVLDMRLYAEKVQNISVSKNLLDSPVYVQGDPSQLAQVFMNIILNAEESLSEVNGGNIIIATEVDGEWVKILIADDGTSIPEENLSQIFYPFFTTKKIGEGTGLGLSICYGIITSHGGLIRSENNDMGGATLIIELPLA